MAELALGTAYNRMFLLVQSADHVSSLTGATPTVTISKGGGAFAAPAGPITEVGNGWYRVAYTAVDTNTSGDLALHAVAAGADPTDVVDQVQPSALIAAGTTITAIGGGGPPRGTLQTYRQRAGQMAGFFWFGSTSSAGASDGSTVVSNAWISTELEDVHLKDTWLYVPSTQENRRIREHGLSGATGTILPDRSFAAQIGSGVPIEVYGRLPAVSVEGRMGLNTIVNRALSECWTLQKISISGVTDQREYQLGTVLPWLQTEDQIAEVYYRPANAAASDDDLLMPRWRFVPGGDNPRLEIGTPVATGDTVKVMLYIPLTWWIYTNGIWGLAATEGLSAEADGGLLDLEGFEIVAGWYVYQEMAKWGGQSADQDRYLKLAHAARVQANMWKRLSLHYYDMGREDHWQNNITVTGSQGYGLQVLSRG